MPYLVDGSNLGGVAAGAAGAQDPAAVLRLLLPWARQRRRVTVVFDGPRLVQLADHYGGLQVRFAAPLSADDVILGLVTKRPADWCVVSEDRQLLAACRALGAPTLGARELLGKLRAGKARSTVERSEAPVDVAEWEAWFRRGGR